MAIDEAALPTRDLLLDLREMCRQWRTQGRSINPAGRAPPAGGGGNVAPICQALEVTSATADAYGYPARIQTYDGTNWTDTYEECRAVKIGSTIAGGVLAVGFYPVGRLMYVSPTGLHVYGLFPGFNSSTPIPSTDLKFSGARVYRTANQTGVGASDTLTAVEFDNEQFDTDGYHDNVTNNSRLTVPTTAYYEIGCNIALDNASATLRTFTAEITLNGTTNICHWQFQLISTDASVRHCNMKTIWSATANDYFQVRVATSDVSGLVVDALASSEPVFWIERRGT